MIQMMLGRGTDGLPPSVPVDFPTLRLPSSPNPWLGSRLAVTLTPPGGPESALVEEQLGDKWIWQDSTGREIATRQVAARTKV